MSTKEELHVRIERAIREQIRLDKAKQQGLSESNIVESILRDHYSNKQKEKADTSMKMLLKRINLSNENLNENLKEIVKLSTENQFMLKQILEGM